MTLKTTPNISVNGPTLEMMTLTGEDSLKGHLQETLDHHLTTQKVTFSFIRSFRYYVCYNWLI